VVSGQRRRFTYFRVESGLGMGPLLPEEWESSPQNWDAPKNWRNRDLKKGQLSLGGFESKGITMTRHSIGAVTLT